MRWIPPVEVLALLAVAALVPSVCEGLVLSKCELKSLMEALTEQEENMTRRVTMEDNLAIIICKVEHTSGFNTSLVTTTEFNWDGFKEEASGSSESVDHPERSGQPGRPGRPGRPHRLRRPWRAWRPFPGRSERPSSDKEEGEREASGSSESVIYPERPDQPGRPRRPGRPWRPWRPFSRRGERPSSDAEEGGREDGREVEPEDRREGSATHLERPDLPSRHGRAGRPGRRGRPGGRHRKGRSLLMGRFFSRQFRCKQEEKRSEEEQGEKREDVLYGVFQLSDRVACASESNRSFNICEMECSALIDDDISDDIACLRTLMSFHGRMDVDLRWKLLSLAAKARMMAMMFPEECAAVVPSEYFSECA